MSQQKIYSFVLLFYYYFLNLGEMWLLKIFKDSNPSMFRGDVDVKVAENWLYEMEKTFKIRQCLDREQALLWVNTFQLLGGFSDGARE